MDPMGQSAIPQVPTPASPPAGTPPPQPQGLTVPPSAPTAPSGTPVFPPPSSPFETPSTPSVQSMDRPIQSLSYDSPSPSPAEPQTTSFTNFSQTAPSQPAISETQAAVPSVPPGGKFYQSKKLIVAAIFIIVSLTTTGLILSQTQKPEPITTTDTQAFTPSPPPLTLSIESPKDETLVTDGTVVIKGATSPNTTVVFYTDAADDSVESDASGNFQGSLSLENGINALTITAYSESGEEKSVTLDVVYDEASI